MGFYWQTCKSVADRRKQRRTTDTVLQETTVLSRETVSLNLQPFKVRNVK